MAKFKNLKHLHESHSVYDEFRGLDNSGICKSVDKKRLYNAVSSLEDKALEVNFAFGKKLLFSGALKPFRVDKLGKIPIPVSLKDFQRLKKVSSPSYYGKGYNKFVDSSKRLALEVDGKKIDSTTAEEMSLSSLVMNHLELPSELMNVQAKLDHMILYESGGHYQHILDSEKEYGSFGTLILQLPVEGGHVGGRLKVAYREKDQVFENHKDSDRSFYVSSFYGNSQHSMEPITRGARLTLTFNLVWENAQNIIPKDFPVFLTAVKEIQESLSSWISADRSIKNNTLISSNAAHTKSSLLKGEDKCEDKDENQDDDEDQDNDQEDDDGDNEDDNEEDQEDDEEDQEDDEEDQEDDEEDQEDDEEDQEEDYEDQDDDYEDQDDDYEDQDDFEDQDDDGDKEQDEDKNREDLLYFVLEEKYEENFFGFSALRGKDRDLAQIFQLCVLLESHLAVVTQTVVTTERSTRGVVNSHHWCECQPYNAVKSTNKISRWEDNNGISRKLSIDINWKKQCVGPQRNLPTSEYKKTDFEAGFRDFEPDDGEGCGVCEKTTSEKCIKHFILVIWPKHQTFRLYCHYGLNSLLNTMEVNKSIIRLIEKTKLDLKKTISVCSSDPRKMLSQKGFKDGELTLRLLRLCVELRACEEGLSLLKIISSDFRLPQERVSNTQEIFEGIKTEQVAEAIVELECRVTGWKDCAEFIKQMISPARIVEQLVPIIKLAQFFLNMDCFEGAKLVGDSISSSFINFDKKEALKIKQPELLSYIELIITMEENAKTANRKRIPSLASLFSKLEPSIQCYVVLELDAQATSRFKNFESFKIMFQALCKALSACDLRLKSFKKKVIIDLICCFFRIGNAEWLRSLTSNILHAQVASEDKNCHSTFEQITSSPVVMKLAQSSDLGVSFIDLLIDSQLAQLTSMNIQSSSRQDDRAQQTSTPAYNSSFSSCLRFMIQMEKNSHKLDAQRLSLRISSLLAKLDFHQLICILTDILTINPTGVKRSSCAVTIIRHIQDALISRLKKDATVMLNRKDILGALDVFITLGDDASFTHNFLKQICENEETGSWSHRMKYNLFLDLLIVPNFWKKLDDRSKVIILKCCDKLIQDWVVDICGSINEPTTSIEASTKLDESILISVRLFFFVESKRFGTDAQKITTQVFQPLISKLNGSQLLELVLKLHQSESSSFATLKLDIKKFPNCMDWYLGISRLLFTMDYISLVNMEVATKILHCLLWLEDEQAWQSFALSVGNAFPSVQSHFFVRIFLINDIQTAVKESSHAFAAFLRIVDKITEKSAFLEEPAVDWRQSKACLPDYAEVEAFLRSSVQAMTYKKFTGIAEARHFAQRLEYMGKSNNFSVSVTVSGSGKQSRCIITKNYDEKAKNFFSLKADLKELVKLRQRLVKDVEAKPLARPISSGPKTDKEVCIVPPNKRPKLT